MGNILDKIKGSEMPVIIYGAGIVGKTLLSVCRENDVTVECFCDSSRKVAQSSFCGMDVVYAPHLKRKYKDAVFLVSVAAIKDVVDFLHDSGYSNLYAGGLLLEDFDVSQNQIDASLDYTKFAIENCVLCHKGYLNRDKLFLRSVDLIITERCSLKCRDCSNLMQYYENPRDCNTDMLLKSVDAFFTVIDEVMDFRIIGGDAFMNREWPVIVKRLAREHRAKRIVLYTNGTIVPSEKDMTCLKNDKVLVIVTNYGVLSRKLVGLKRIFEENKILHYILNVTEWLDCSAITPHHRTVSQNKEIFRMCCAKNMATLSDGKLFRCPYAANAFRLSAVPDNKSDYVDLFQKSCTKSEVRTYLFEKDYLKTCEYCNGRPLSGNEVQPAVQVDKPLVYHKYTSNTKRG